MVNGLYTASMSMTLLQQKQDVTANNLANAHSAGFKFARLLTRAEVTIQRNDQTLLHQDESQKMDEVRISFTQGSLNQTDNPLDFALTGNGFFAVETESGVRYTRQGSFSLNSMGELVNQRGERVLDQLGAGIRLHPKEELTVSSDGGLFADEMKIGRIAILDFPKQELLIHEGEGKFKNTDQPGNAPFLSPDTQIRQGFVESSNVAVIRTMVDMITQFRNYEASQKALHAVDGTLQKAVSEVGRVS